MGDINTKVGYISSDMVPAAWNGVPNVTPPAIPMQEICYQDSSGNAHGVTELADTGNKLTNQLALAANFIGLANQRKMVTDATGTIEIDRVAVKYMTCNALSAAVNVGAMVAGSCTSGTALQSGMVEITTIAAAAIGQVIAPAVSGATQLLVAFRSRVIFGSISSLSAKAAAVNAAGTAIGNATQLTAQANLVSGANNAAGVQLLPIVPGTALPQYVRNLANAANTGLLVYPAVNCAIMGAAANAAYNLAGNSSVIFWSDGNASYYT